MTPASTRAVRVALVSALALGTVITGLGSASAQPEATSAVRPAAWGPCGADVLAEIPAAERTKVSCAVQTVPVDHSRPRGDSTGVVMMKRPAGDPAKKIGSLFINPGGPGGAGLIYSAYGSSFFTPEILEKFDLIGFDPRGVGRSAPLRCFRTQEEAEAVNEGWYALPITKDEIASSIR
ncbi:hypothetical protein SK571_28615 [Lentzea sp. BCCO 10_0798]|uniref:TAP-like protein n=1 Tax=Lentzea kristufekii TaxID=3095430 RepID=A0ABU4U002_9PSEU|nr:hypothetical protein [Lentzea sp. BCCO 10_0798]MDX8053356.1 hypothetical protein [Lentzea sp. BCCO 10_0798]